MKNLFIYCTSLSILVSSCALYTKSNVTLETKRQLKRNLVTNNYNDVTSGYKAIQVTTPLLLAHQKVTTTETFIPVGLDLFYSTRNFGTIDANFYYLTEGFLFGDKKKFNRTFNASELRFDGSFVYAFPIWRKTAQIDQFQMNIGQKNRNNYIAILPTNVDIEFAVRGGLAYELNSFYSQRVDHFIQDQYTTNSYSENFGGNIRFRSLNTTAKFGAIFQRRVATRFNTQIDGNNFYSSIYQTKGVYFDILILMRPDRTQEKVGVIYENESPLGSTFSYEELFLSQTDLFQRRLMGATIGYKYRVTGKSSGLTLRLDAEFGFLPGYFPDVKSSLKANLGVGIGFGTRK